MRFFISILFLLWGLPCHCQQTGLPPDARINGLGYATTARNDVFSIAGSSAALPFISESTISASIQNRFFVSELFDFSISGVFPLKNAGIGIYVEHFDFESYRQQVFSAAYGLKLHEAWMIGLRFNYFNYSITEERTKGLISGSLALIYSLSNNLRIGFETNPISNNSLNNSSNLATHKLGLNYSPSSYVSLSTDIIYTPGLINSFSAAVGLSYEIQKTIELHLGYRSNPDYYSIGLGVVLLEGLRLYMSASVHQQLGVTPVSGFDYRFRRDK